MALTARATGLDQYHPIPSRPSTDCSTGTIPDESRGKLTNKAMTPNMPVKSPIWEEDADRSLCAAGNSREKPRFAIWIASIAAIMAATESFQLVSDWAAGGWGRFPPRQYA